MPSTEWTGKRKRQYEHIKDGLVERGKAEPLAEEIAARTVNKVRAQAGESETASRASVDDLPPSRRGGLRSHQGEGGRTQRQLYEEARKRNIAGRSRMSKAELERVLKR